MEQRRSELVAGCKLVAQGRQAGVTVVWPGRPWTCFQVDQVHRAAVTHSLAAAAQSGVGGHEDPCVCVCVCDL